MTVNKNNFITSTLWLAVIIIAVIFSKSVIFAYIPGVSKLAKVKTASTVLVAPPKVVAAVVTPPPAPAAPKQVVKTTRRTTVVKAQPVVTPAPAASVSGLDPVAPPSSAGPATTTGYTSTNWSGYLSTSGTFTSVSASWHATPAIGISGTVSADSTWVGIGGVTSGDLIQVGTDNIIDANGNVTPQAFYELLPAASTTITTMTVSQGDSISASVLEISAGEWEIHIADNTNGQSFNTTTAYTSTHSSAEWVQEDPSSGFRHLIPFDNFQTATFTGGTATVNGSGTNISGANSVPITMINRNSQNIAVPSAISGDGGRFSVTRTGL